MSNICPHCGAIFTTRQNLDRHIQTAKKCINNRKPKIINYETEYALLKQKLEFTEQLLAKEKLQTSKLEKQLSEYKTRDDRIIYSKIDNISSIAPTSISTTNNISGNTIHNETKVENTLIININPIYSEESKSFYLPTSPKIMKERLPKFISPAHFYETKGEIIKRLTHLIYGHLTMDKNKILTFYNDEEKKFYIETDIAIFMDNIYPELINMLNNELKYNKTLPEPKSIIDPWVNFFISKKSVTPYLFDTLFSICKDNKFKGFTQDEILNINNGRDDKIRNQLATLIKLSNPLK